MTSVYIPADLRRRVAQQSGGRCRYCLSSEAISGIPLDIDHVMPSALGGPTVEGNLCSACSRCNSYKGDRVAARDPESGDLVALFNPCTQDWNDHFEWTESGERILGKTPTGRATVISLRLNRPLVVNARRSWASVGWHPPKDE